MRRLGFLPNLRSVQRSRLDLEGLQPFPLGLCLHEFALLKEALTALLGQALGQGLGQVVRQLLFMRFAHSGLLDRSAPGVFPVAFDYQVRDFYPEGLCLRSFSSPPAFKRRLESFHVYRYTLSRLPTRTTKTRNTSS